VSAVEPIRDKEKVKQLIGHFKSGNKQKDQRNYLMVLFGLYTGLRISDILKVKKHMITDSHLTVKEQKTGKNKRIVLVPELKKALKNYTVNLDDDDYLFHGSDKSKPISREWAYRILNGAANEYGIKRIGTHSLRKTFGYHMYAEHKNVALLQNIFNHSSEAITLNYIGINQDEIDDAMKRLRF